MKKELKDFWRAFRKTRWFEQVLVLLFIGVIPLHFFCGEIGMGMSTSTTAIFWLITFYERQRADFYREAWREATR